MKARRSSALAFCSLLILFLSVLLVRPTLADDFYAPGAVWKLKDGYPKPDEDLLWHHQNTQNRIQDGNVVCHTSAGVVMTWSYTVPPDLLVVGRTYKLGIRGVSTSHPGPPHGVMAASYWAGQNVTSLHDEPGIYRQGNGSRAVIPPPARDDYKLPTSDEISFVFRPELSKYALCISFNADGNPMLVYEYEPYRPGNGIVADEVVEHDRPAHPGGDQPGQPDGARMVVTRSFPEARPPVDTAMIRWSIHCKILLRDGTGYTGIFWQPCFKPGVVPGLGGGQITFLDGGRLDRVVQFVATDLVSVEAEALIKWVGDGPTSLPVIDRPDLTYRDIDRAIYTRTGDSTQVHPSLFFVPVPPLKVELGGSGVHLERNPDGSFPFDQIPTYRLRQNNQPPPPIDNPDPMPLNVFTTEHDAVLLSDPAVWPDVASSVRSGWHQLFASQGHQSLPPRLESRIKLTFIDVGPGNIGGRRGANSTGFARANTALMANQLADAARLLGDVRTEYPDDREIACFWGLVEISRGGDVGTVLVLAERLLAAVPNDPQALLLHGQAALFSGQTEVGVRSLSAARALSPELMEGVYQEANRMLEGGVPAIAYVQYRSLLWMNPPDQRAYFGLGYAAMNLGRAPEAIEAFERYLQYDPSSGFAAKVREQLRILRRDSILIK